MKSSVPLNVIDWFSLAARMDNDEAYISETIVRWFSDYAQTLDVLKNAVDTRRYDDIFILAHKIRGSSAIFGMDLLSDAAAKLEDAGRRCEYEQVNELMQAVRDEFEKVRAFVAGPDWIENAKRQSETAEKSLLMKE